MKTVFLDLDGTLTDAGPGIIASVAHALEELGHDAPPHDALKWVVGPALVDTFARLGVTDPHAALAIYRRRYTDVGMFENSVYPGVFDMLETLASGYRLCLATAKPHAYATAITDHFGLNRHLFAEFGPELDGSRNDKGELLAHALDTLGLAASECVMVGDRHHDFDAAERVGMRSIAVTWGYGALEEYRRADRVCETPAALPDVVRALLN